MGRKTILHLEFDNTNLQPTKDNQEGKHFYFGSIAAIFEKFKRETLGVAIRALYVFGIEENNPYENGRIIIRKGIVTKKPPTKIKSI